MRISYRCINGNLNAGVFVLLLASTLAVTGCKGDPSLFGGCSTSNMGDCPPSEGFENPYEGQLELLTWTETLRKASLELTGRLPTQQQIDATEQNGQIGLEASLAEMMRDPRFSERMIELYNDHFLTDKYLGQENAIELLDQESYPNLRWFETMRPGDEQVALTTNDSLAREPLELIAHVIRNESPFTEILTADYTMANAYSAMSFLSIPGVPVGLGKNPETYQPTHIPGIPHAGILTSPMFLNRFPTSDTNVNRHRSRMTYWFFLDIDINRFGSRPVDASADFGENPTLNNPDCTVCHTTLDPVAGLYMNWDEGGRYSGRGEWYDGEMLAPGFNGEEIPGGQRKTALQWLGRRLAENPRFAQATVKTVFEGLTGQKVLDLSIGYVVPDMPGSMDPDDGAGGAGGTGNDMGVGGMGGDIGVGGMGGDIGVGGMGGDVGVGGMGGDVGMGGTGGDPTMPPPPPPPPLPEIEEELDPNAPPAIERAYQVQQQILRTIQSRFIDSNYNFKLLVREIILSPYFRAKNATPLSAEMELELSTFGTARLLTPEHLSRKIEATTGVRWRRNPNNTDFLLGQYLIFYGGIDSDLVTKRVTEPNGVMASLAQRMAYEVACSAVPYDFSKNPNDRLLFPNIERGTALGDSEQVREAVQHLHKRILGEDLATNDDEITATLAVLTEAYNLGRDGLATGSVPEDLADPCRLNNERITGASLPDDRRINRDPDYTVRAWMAAVSYLLSDYRYLYE